MPPPVTAAAAFGIGYRPMTDEDLPFVSALFASTRAEEVAATGWPPEMQRAFLEQQHRAQHQHYRQVNPEGEWLIVEQGGAPIGRLYLNELEGELHLIDISLLPEARGAGLGGAIMADLMADAAGRAKPITLYVEKFNPARRLYVRLGFEAVEDKGVHDRMRWHPGQGA
ncbi:MAG TPA: GNAT family N-acetyltransferase [Allosphingosinicella sp.]|nr:GNAT family N-acetyltransferase [Allosphingosinicella sp.]